MLSKVHGIHYLFIKSYYFIGITKINLTQYIKVYKKIVTNIIP